MRAMIDIVSTYVQFAYLLIPEIITELAALIWSIAVHICYCKSEIQVDPCVGAMLYVSTRPLLSSVVLRISLPPGVQLES